MPATRRQMLAAAAALPLLGLRTARAATRVPGHLVMGISGWPATLAPWANAGTVAQNAKLLIHRGLLGYGPDGQMRGELAERWERAEDGAWVFHLRDAVFHNGDPVTADDVRYSIEQIAADKSPAYMKGEMARIIRDRHARCAHRAADDEGAVGGVAQFVRQLLHADRRARTRWTAAGWGSAPGRSSWPGRNAAATST